MPQPDREVRVSFDGDRRGLSPATVRRVVEVVCDGEEVGAVQLSVTFLSASRVRTMNRRAFGRDRATDVIAFGMQHGEVTVGDLYVCPAIGRAQAAEAGITPREELVRLVIHGLLHVLGHDHPADATRRSSEMWRRQERYCESVCAGWA